MSEESSLEMVLANEIEYCEGLPKDSDEYAKSIDRICHLVDKLNDNVKIQLDYDVKNEELEIKKSENDIKKRENEIKSKQVDNDKKRIIVEIGKIVGTLSVFTLFEVLAHNLDKMDVIARDPLHIKNNTIKNLIKF